MEHQGGAWIRDTGVLLGYLSPGQLDEIRRTEDKSYRQIGAVEDPLSISDRRLEQLPSDVIEEVDTEGAESRDIEIANYDPIARALYAHPNFDNVRYHPREEKLRYHAQSVLEHERVHRDIAETETHLYEAERLGTFLATLELVNGPRREMVTPASEPGQSMFMDPVNRCGSTLVFSELAQEAAAISGQRSWIRTIDGGGRFKSELLAEIDAMCADKMDQALTEADSSKVADGTAHAFSDWLLKEVIDDRWSIDPIRYAFSFTTGTHTVHPDVVVLAAAQVEPSELEDCSPATELTLLVEEVERITNRMYRYLVPPHGDSSSSIADHRFPKRFKLIRPDRQLAKIRGTIIEELQGQGRYTAIPLIATDYPGLPEGKHLWQILSNITVIGTGRGTRRVHQVMLDEEIHAWAANTRALELAFALWELRENTFMEILRRWRRRSSYDNDAVLAAAKHLESDGVLSETHPRELLDFDAEVISEAHTQVLRNRSELYSRYEAVFDDLRTLGQALLAPDRNTVKDFF